MLHRNVTQFAFHYNITMSYIKCKKKIFFNMHYFLKYLMHFIRKCICFSISVQPHKAVYHTVKPPIIFVN